MATYGGSSLIQTTTTFETSNVIASGGVFTAGQVLLFNDVSDANIGGTNSYVMVRCIGFVSTTGASIMQNGLLTIQKLGQFGSNWYSTADYQIDAGSSNTNEVTVTTSISTPASSGSGITGSFPYWFRLLPGERMTLSSKTGVNISSGAQVRLVFDIIRFYNS